MPRPRHLIPFLAIAVLLAACGAAQPTSPTPSAPAPVAAPTDIWAGLQLREPVAYSTPLPGNDVTPIDGSYALYDASWPQWWACLRCADYRPAGGIWKLRFDRGAMRIYYNVTGWHSLSSYTVDSDRLTLFNDPYCPDVVGEYRWRIEDRWGLDDRVLVLEPLNDPCSIALRAENLARHTWFSCQPPNLMTGASGHYHQEPGCAPLDPAALLAAAPASPAGLTVAVHPLHSKHFTTQPDLFVDATPAQPVPDGLALSFSDASIPYGLTRVLWGELDWAQISVTRDATAIGVQIYGKNTMGWARVLFDGAEVWRGDTLMLGQQNDYFGGYVQVSGFAPGAHTLRVEALGVDYRPVTIHHFGINLTGSAAP